MDSRSDSSDDTALVALVSSKPVSPGSEACPAGEPSRPPGRPPLLPKNGGESTPVTLVSSAGSSSSKSSTQKRSCSSKSTTAKRPTFAKVPKTVSSRLSLAKGAGSSSQTSCPPAPPSVAQEIAVSVSLREESRAPTPLAQACPAGVPSTVWDPCAAVSASGGTTSILGNPRMAAPLPTSGVPPPPFTAGGSQGYYGYPPGYALTPTGSSFHRMPGLSDPRMFYPNVRGYSLSAQDAAARPAWPGPRAAGYPDPWWVPPAPYHAGYATYPSGFAPRGDGTAYPSWQWTPGPRPRTPAWSQPPTTSASSSDRPPRESQPLVPRDTGSVIDSELTSEFSLDQPSPPRESSPPPPTLVEPNSDWSEEESGDYESKSGSAFEDSEADPQVDYSTSDLAALAIRLLDKYEPELISRPPAPSSLMSGLLLAKQPKPGISLPPQFGEAVRSEVDYRLKTKRSSVHKLGQEFSFEKSSMDGLFLPKKISSEALRFGEKIHAPLGGKTLSEDRHIQEVEAGIRGGMRLSAFLNILLSLRARAKPLKISSQDLADLDKVLVPLSGLVFHQLAATSLLVTEDRQKRTLARLKLEGSLDLRAWAESMDPSSPFLFGGQFNSRCKEELDELKQADELAEQASGGKRKPRSTQRKSKSTRPAAPVAEPRRKPREDVQGKIPVKRGKAKSKKSSSHGPKSRTSPPSTKAKAKGGRG